jgi:hypothetical protein
VTVEREAELELGEGGQAPPADPVAESPKVWTSLINADTDDEEVLGVFTSEEQALAAANRVSPEAADAMPFVLDEVPDWVAGFEREREAGFGEGPDDPFGESRYDLSERRHENGFAGHGDDGPEENCDGF